MISVTYDDPSHTYTVNGRHVPSVTTVNGATTPKGGLPWWGMRVGFAAVCGLLQDGTLTFPEALAQDLEDLRRGDCVNHPELGTAGKSKEGATPKVRPNLEAAVVRAKLDVNNVRDAAGDQGTAIHEVLQEMALTEKLPDLDRFPPEQRPYLQGLVGWWTDIEPEFEAQEVVLGSAKYGYAGRTDLIAKINGERCVVDLKTGSSADYPEVDRQLMAYAMAENEMQEEAGTGVDPITGAYVLHLVPRSSTGYLMWSAWSPEAFLSFAARLDAYWHELAECEARRVRRGLRGEITKRQQVELADYLQAQMRIVA